MLCSYRRRALFAAVLPYRSAVVPYRSAPVVRSPVTASRLIPFDSSLRQLP